MGFDRERMKTRAAELAARGVFIGTSSWKYEGWLGQLYTPSRYEYRGKVAATRFEKGCLTEYAEVFKTVCVDAAYYTFPSHKYLEGLMGQVPADFRFGFKVTDQITIKKSPNLPRFGERAGKPNEHFLNAKLFEDAFLKTCEPFRGNVGLLMFEFSRFHSGDYEHGRDFIADLDKFLAALPKGLFRLPRPTRCDTRFQQLGCHGRSQRTDGPAWQSDESEPRRRPLSFETGQEVRRGGEDVSAV